MKQIKRQQGAVLLLMLLLILIVAANWGLACLNRRPATIAYQMLPTVHAALQQTRAALLTWATDRLAARERWQCQAQAANRPLAPSPVPLGLLPYPDRRGTDRDYNGHADCPAWHSNLTNSAANRYRIGRLPYRGEDTPCESLGLNGNKPEQIINDLICQKADGGIPASEQIAMTAPANLAFAALDIRIPLLTPSGWQLEVPWYAASRHVLDDAENDQYPQRTIEDLLTINQGWLTVCDQSGHTLTREAAFVVISPGIAVAGQDRSASAPTIEQYLDRYTRPQGINSTHDVCQFTSQSNADYDEVFVANQGLSASFNDDLLFVTRQEMARALAIAEARRWAGYLSMAAAQNGNRYPYAANAGGICQQQQLQGYLPFVARPDCLAGANNLPPSRGPGARQYHQIHYAVNAQRNQVTLQFTGCAMEFSWHLSPTGTVDAFAYTPNHC